MSSIILFELRKEENNAQDKTQKNIDISIIFILNNSIQKIYFTYE